MITLSLNIDKIQKTYLYSEIFLFGGTMHILIINFKADFSPEDYNLGTSELAPVFAEVEGLNVKNFIFNHETKTYGGCYMFENKKVMEDYKAGEIYKSIIENPDWTDFLVRDFEVHAEATEIQNRLKEKAA